MSKTQEVIKIYKDCLKEWKEESTCPVCLSVLVDPYALPCNHYFCHGCIGQVHQHMNGQCPTCRRKFSKRNIIKDDTVADVTSLFRKLFTMGRLFKN